MPKCLLITDGIAPYRNPLFNLINKNLARFNIEFITIFVFEKARNRKWTINKEEINYKYRILSNNKGFKSSILYYLYKEKPTVIISAGFGLNTIYSLSYSFIFRKDLIIWTGSTTGVHDNLTYLKRVFRKYIFKIEGIQYIVYSSLTRQYLLFHGVAKERIKISLNNIDTNFYKTSVEKLLKTEVERDPKKLLYVGYLNKRKNVQNILEIIRQLSDIRRDFSFHIVGDGPERYNLENIVQQWNLTKLVFFYGYKQKDELPLFYASAGIFLFQTDYDIWGLVLNEAMASSLCCLSSVNASATHDLIKDSSIGFQVDFNKRSEIIDILNHLLDNPKEIFDIGKAAQNFMIKEANLDESADVFVRLIKETVNKSFQL